MELHPQLQRALAELGLEGESSLPSESQWRSLLALASEGYGALQQQIAEDARARRDLSDTLRAATETQVAGERDRFGSILSALSDGLCVLDERGVVTSVNAAAAGLLRCAEGGVVGRGVLDRFVLGTTDPEADVQPWEALREELERSVPLAFERSLILHGDGSCTPVCCVFNPLRKAGDTVGCVLVIRDATSDRRHEAELLEMIGRLERSEAELQNSRAVLEGRVAERTAELEAANRKLKLQQGSLLAAKEEAEAAAQVKARFLATMSHEIRTPLNGVIGLIQLLLQGALHPDQRQIAHSILSSGGVLRNLVNDILDYSKIEAGKMELYREPFEVHNTLEEVLELFAASARAKQLELIYRPIEDLPTTIVGDRRRLMQVLSNLLSNALKFCDAGEVEVTAQRNKRWEGGVELLFSVRDTGIGIEPEKFELLFDAFSQVASNQELTGTGLGLAISRRLTELQGGRIWIESEPGQGACFLFTIRAGLPHVPHRSQHLSELADKRVLIVEANASQRAALAGWCRRWQLLPTECADLTAAQSLLEAEPQPELLLLDAGESEASRMCAARLADAPGARIRCLLMVSGPLPGELPEGVDGFVRKPIRHRKLQELLLHVLQGGAQEPDGSSAVIFDHQDFEGIELLGVDAELASRLPLSILIAEDSPVNQLVARKLLESMGYEPDVAEHSDAILAMLEAGSYDLVFMDVQLPGRDGYEVTREICQRWGEERPRIIAVTANALVGDRELCLQAGMDDYLPKPIDFAAMQTAIEEWGPRCPRLRAKS